MDWQDIRDFHRARPGFWFRPKMFGWGATPVTWQGWALTLGFAAALVAIATAFEPSFAVLFALPLVTGFILLAWRRTDGEWRWRWGAER